MHIAKRLLKMCQKCNKQSFANFMMGTNVILLLQAKKRKVSKQIQAKETLHGLLLPNECKLYAMLLQTAISMGKTVTRRFYRNAIQKQQTASQWLFVFKHNAPSDKASFVNIKGLHSFTALFYLLTIPSSLCLCFLFLLLKHIWQGRNSEIALGSAV